jgi:hypothetical protein
MNKDKDLYGSSTKASYISVRRCQDTNELSREYLNNIFTLGYEGGDATDEHQDNQLLS